MKFWRTRTPLVLQMEEVECGAACLGIVLGHYKKFVSLGELRFQCSVSRDGSQIGDIIDAGVSYGLEGDVFEMGVEGLQKAQRPLIVLLDFSHFVVVERFSKKKVYVNDPAFGRLAISRGEFEKHFSGVAIDLQPGKGFKRSERQPGMMQKLKERWIEKPSAFLFLFLSGILLFLPTLFLPITIRIFIDNLPISNAIFWKVEILGFLLLATVFGGIISIFHRSILQKVSRSMSQVISTHLLKKLLRFPLSYYDQREPRTMVKGIEMGSAVGETLVEEMLPAMVHLFLSLSYAALMFAYNTILALVTLLGALTCLGGLYLICYSRQTSYISFKKTREESESWQSDVADVAETIHTLGVGKYVWRVGLDFLTRFINQAQAIGKKEIVINTFPFFITFFCTALLMGVGGEEMIRGRLTLGMMASLQFLLLLFLMPLYRFVTLFEKLYHMGSVLCRMDDVTYTSIDPFFEKHQNVEKVAIQHLEFKQVAFGYYPFGEMELEGISFSIAPGEWVGLVGPVSSGKSTVGQLAASLLHPSEGKVLYGGKKAQEIEEKVFRKTVGWLGEDSPIFPGSLRDNITLWDERFSEDQVAAILKKVGLKEGLYWTRLRGKHLCASEREQVALARLLIREPKLLIIDDALFALNEEKQEEILSHIRSMGSSVLWIGHNRLIPKHCNVVLTLEEGELRG